MIRHLQFLGLLLKTFLSRHKKYIAFGVIIGFFLSLLLLQTYSFYERLSAPKTKKIGIVGRFREGSLPITIQNKISLGLTALTAGGLATPSLAKKWEIDSSQKVYTIYLNSDIFWHDGKKFKTQDINYKIKDAVIKPIDETTLKITLNEPYSPLPTILSRPLLRPNLVGLGVYRAGKIKYTGDLISELTLKPQVTGLETLVYKFYPNTQDAILAFKLGEADILQNVTEISDLTNWQKVNIQNVNLYDSFIGIFFNLKDPLFKEKEARQALSYAIPNMENFTRAYTPISPLSWAYSQKVRLYRYDEQTASKILAKSQISSSSTELTLTTYASLIQTAQFIAEAWKKVGLNVKVKVINSITDDYQILLISQAIPADPDQYQFWQSTQTRTNLAHYSNLKIDKLLEDGRKTSDLEKRKKIYADFQKYLVDDAPVIFLYYPKVYTVERK